MFEVFGILFLVIVLPLGLILHYVTKWKQSKTISGDDERMLEDLYDSTERIDERIRNIERILDAEHPEWRKEI
ncbi:MAG: envelope stress response membrane protein PspB [Pseudomonadota bacterium]